KLVFKIMDWHPTTIMQDLTKPQGVASRAADLTKARQVLSWEPQTSYYEGFKKTIEWYTQTHDQNQVRANLQTILMER
ncbi:MAG: NAD-dependent dehydratase, partial [Candidatus Bathyarchaeota archaeon]